MGLRPPLLSDFLWGGLRREIPSSCMERGSDGEQSQSVQAEGKYRQRHRDRKGQMPLTHNQEPYVLVEWGGCGSVADY